MSPWPNELPARFEARMQRVFRTNMRVVDATLRLSGSQRLLRTSRALVTQSRRSLLA